MPMMLQPAVVINYNSNRKEIIHKSRHRTGISYLHLSIGKHNIMLRLYKPHLHEKFSKGKGRLVIGLD